MVVLEWDGLGGGGGGQAVLLQQVTSQKLVVESKGIFQTRSDLSFLSTDKTELHIGIWPQKTFYTTDGFRIKLNPIVVE